MSCAACSSPLVPRWDAQLICPVCTGAHFPPSPEPSAHPDAVSKVARFEAYAVERGWTLGELWNTDGWHCARGLVCYVHPDQRVRLCDDKRIVLVRMDPHGKEICHTFRRKPQAAAVPVDRLRLRPQSEAA